MPTITPVFGQSLIISRVERMAEEIAKRQYVNLLTVTLLKGGAMLSADLSRAMWRQKVPFEMAYANISLYNDDMTRRKKPVLQMIGDAPPVARRDILLIDDTIGTGETYHNMYWHFRTEGARDIDMAVAVNATGKKRVENFNPTYALFTINDDAFFRVGYGEDVNGLHREVPFIGRYEE